MIEMSVQSQEGERSCILCDRDTTLRLCDISIGFWNCSDSVVFIVFHFISAHDAFLEPSSCMLKVKS